MSSPDLNKFVGSHFNDVKRTIELAYPSIRVVSGNSLLTQDYVSSRLNVYVDNNGVITGFDFG